MISSVWEGVSESRGRRKSVGNARRMQHVRRCATENQSLLQHVNLIPSELTFFHPERRRRQLLVFSRTPPDLAALEWRSGWEPRTWCLLRSSLRISFPRTSLHSIVDGPRKSYIQSSRHRTPRRVQTGPAWLPFWSRGRRDNAALALRETLAAWENRIRIARDG